MKTKMLFLVLVVVFLLACGVSSEQMTATAVMAKAQTQTAAPTRTSTSTPRATSTPRPTATPEPTQTPIPPAAIGETVEYKGMEITLLRVRTYPKIIVHSSWYYDAKPGYTFIDLTVRVRNHKYSTISVDLGNIYVIDKNGDAWMPFCGDFKTVDLEKSFDPATIISWDEFSRFDKIDFRPEKDTYLRLLLPVLQDEDVVFGIENSPQFTFTVK
ncbi:MAG TPA: hypothetical protein VKP08_18170 [Anaerolineales bacterium]|nr:hypothetical protein [Anaerolineales bacterium]